MGLGLRQRRQCLHVFGACRCPTWKATTTDAGSSVAGMATPSIVIGGGGQGPGPLKPVIRSWRFRGRGSTSAPHGLLRLLGGRQMGQRRCTFAPL